MQGQNLFERAERRNRKGMNAALILVAIGLLGVFLIFYMGNHYEKGRQPLKNLSQSKDKLVEARLIWADYAFAEGGKDKRFYHLVQLEDYSIVAVSLTKDTHLQFTALIDKDPYMKDWKNNPYVLKGMVGKTSLQLQSYLAERFEAMQIKGDEKLSLTDARRLLMVEEGKRPSSQTWPYLFLLPGIIGLVLLMAAAGNRKALGKARDTVAQTFPSGFEADRLDAEPQLDIPTLKLKVQEPLLISEGNRLDVMDLHQVGWIYQRTIRHYFIATNSFLQIHDKNRKLTAISLPGRPKAAGEALAPLWAYLSEHYPDIQLGFGEEQRQHYMAHSEKV